MPGERSAVFRVDRIPGVDAAKLARRPLTVRILLENLVRHYDPRLVDVATVVRLANTGDSGARELPFYPSRVLLQDFTGIPAIVDLTAMRSAAERVGLPVESINPDVPVDLIVDHSVQVDSYGSPRSLAHQPRPRVRAQRRAVRLPAWAKQAYRDVRIVPPGNGHLPPGQPRVPRDRSSTAASDASGEAVAFPDTLVGTDSHTTMVNGLGVLGWGVGGIEAEAVMLGEPCFLPPIEVVGVRLSGTPPRGGDRDRPRPDRHPRPSREGGPREVRGVLRPRARLPQPCPTGPRSRTCVRSTGATAALFPVDAATIRYLQGTGRDPAIVRRVEAYAPGDRDVAGRRRRPSRSSRDVLEVDLGNGSSPTVSGPKNPEQSVRLADAPQSFHVALAEYRGRAPSEGGRRQRGTPATGRSSSPRSRAARTRRTPR